MRPAVKQIDVFAGNDKGVLFALRGPGGEPLDPAGATFDVEVFSGPRLIFSQPLEAVETETALNFAWLVDPVTSSRWRAIPDLAYRFNRREFGEVHTYITGPVAVPTHPGAATGDTTIALTVSDGDDVTYLIVGDTSADAARTAADRVAVAALRIGTAEDRELAEIAREEAQAAAEALTDAVDKITFLSARTASTREVLRSTNYAADVQYISVLGEDDGIAHTRRRVPIIDVTQYACADELSADGARWRVEGREVDARVLGLLPANDHLTGLLAMRAAFDFCSEQGRNLDLMGQALKMGAPAGTADGVYLRPNFMVLAQGSTIDVAFNASGGTRRALFMNQTFDAPVHNFRWWGGAGPGSCVIKRDTSADGTPGKYFWEGSVIYAHGNDNYFTGVKFYGFASATEESFSGGGRFFQGGGTCWEAIANMGLTSGTARIVMPAGFIFAPDEGDGTYRIEIPGAATAHVISVTVQNPGANYGQNTTAAVVGGGGTGAVLKVSVFNGTVRGIDVVAPGTGYDNTATIVITDPSGNGSGATAVEVLSTTLWGWIDLVQYDAGTKRWSCVLVNSFGTAVPSITSATATGRIDRCGTGFTFEDCEVVNAYDNDNKGSAAFRLTMGGSTFRRITFAGSGNDAAIQYCPLNRDNFTIRGAIAEDIRRAGSQTGRMVLISSGGNSGSGLIAHGVYHCSVRWVQLGFSGGKGIRICHNGGTLGRVMWIDVQGVTIANGAAFEGGNTALVIDTDREDESPVTSGTRLVDHVNINQLNASGTVDSAVFLKGRLGVVRMTDCDIGAPRTTGKSAMVVSSDSVQLWIDGTRIDCGTDADGISFGNTGGGNAYVHVSNTNFSGIKSGKSAVNFNAKDLELVVSNNNFDGDAGGFAFTTPQAGGSGQILRIGDNTYHGVKMLRRRNGSLGTIVTRGGTTFALPTIPGPVSSVPQTKTWQTPADAEAGFIDFAYLGASIRVNYAVAGPILNYNPGNAVGFSTNSADTTGVIISLASSGMWTFTNKTGAPVEITATVGALMPAAAA